MIKKERIKKIIQVYFLSGIFVFSQLFSVSAINIQTDKTPVQLTNFRNDIDSSNEVIELEQKAGDNFGMLMTDDPANIKYKSFIFEADVISDSGANSACLVFGSSGVNDDGVAQNWYGANFHYTNEGEQVRVFGSGISGNYAASKSKIDEIGINLVNNPVHLYLNVDETGTFVYRLTDLTNNKQVELDGVISNWGGGYIGLLTFDSHARFSNVTILDTTPDPLTKDKVEMVSDVVKDFVYETDIKFNERIGSSHIIFRTSEDLTERYEALIDSETGKCSIVKYENNVPQVIVQPEYVSLNNKNEYHVKIVVIGKHFVYFVNDVLVGNTADYVMNTANSSIGQNDAYLEGLVGNQKDENITFTNSLLTEITDDNTPQLSDLTISSDLVDKQIQFAHGQYVYIGYVKNKAENIALNVVAAKGSQVTVTDEENNEVDINNLILNVGKNTFTLTVSNNNATVIYRLMIHRMVEDEKYYNEEYRDQYHYSVKQGWANDPNGMVYFNGKYHLFYQFYNDTNWGPMHWAHATSTDLIHWEEQPIEFYPDEYGAMFSGCAVIADHETAPELFQKGESGIVAMITADGSGQKITIAYSKDGENWQKYEEGKVILHWTDDTSNTLTEHKPAFRDPKVFRYEDTWFMVIAGGPLRIFSSKDLINWQLESAYRDLHTECPDLYPVQASDGTVKWVLSRGGRFYKLGDFSQDNEGHWRYMPDNEYVASWYKDENENKWADRRSSGYMGENSWEANDGVMNFGKDSYAAMTYYIQDFGTKNNLELPRIISINWMNTWDNYCNDVDDKTNNDIFNGTFNLQLEQSLVKDSNGKYLLKQTPLTEYEMLRDVESKITLNNVVIDEKNNLLNDFKSDCYEIIANLKPLEGTNKVGFKLRVGNNEETVVLYDFTAQEIYIDRSCSGIIVSDRFAEIDKQINVMPCEDGSIDLHIFVDRASVEVFTKNDTIAGANQIFPSTTSLGLEVLSIGGQTLGNIEIYQLNSIWSKAEAETVNKTALQIAVDTANMLKDQGALNDVVPAVAAEFESALDNAKIVLADTTADQTTVDSAFYRLANAIHMLGFIKGDKTALEALIEEAEKYAEENYTTDSWTQFKEALDAAKEVAADENALEKDVEDAYNSLKDAMANLVLRADKTRLQSLYDMVDGLDKSLYTEASVAGLTDPMANAQAVLANADATQEEVDSAYEALIRAYVDLRLIPNKDLLNDLINKANGLNEAEYTAASWKVMNEALNDAIAVLNDPEASQAEVDNAKDVLTKAVAGLRAVDNTVKPEDTTSIKTGDDSMNEIFAGLGLLSMVMVLMSYKWEKNQK